jgi:pilus assembly protein FimV
MSRKLILASTMTMILAGNDVSALGLGGLKTYSVLNQPLSAEIDLNDVKADELDAVKASIASPEAFAKAGLERYHYLTRLKFTPAVSAQGRPVIRVSSREPIREPFLDMLVEVVWSSGQLMKQYTALMDPPVTTSRAAPSVIPPLAATSAGRASSLRGQSSGYVAAPGGGFPIVVGPVGSGMGLWEVARQHAPAGATVAQTAMALYRNNQRAFVRGNINKMIAGETLIVPTRDELFALDASAAQREFGSALHGRTVRRAPMTEIPPEVLSSRLRIAGAAPSGSTSTAMAANVLTSQAAAPTSPRGPGVEKDLMLALETSESARQETVELRDRIKDLEKQLSDIQGLLQVRNAELARVQDSAAASSPAQSLPTTPTGEPGVSAVEPPLPGSTATATLPAFAETTQTSGTEQAGVTSEASTSPSSAEGAEVPSPDETAPGLLPLPSVPETPDTQTPAAPSAATQLSPGTSVQGGEDEASTWHSLLLPLAGLAGVTALGILLFSWVTARRRQEEAKGSLGLDDLDAEGFHEAPTQPRSSRFYDERSSLRESLSDTHSLHSKDDEEGQESPVSMMSSLSNFDAETDEADVLSEADIYIAYGRHAEAQELLLAELKRFPSRLDIKYKLGEAYAGAKDVPSLRRLMDEIESAGGDRADPAQWRRLRELCERTQSVSADTSRLSGAASAAAAAVIGGTSAVAANSSRADSLDLGSDDTFSLDVSDLQRAASGSQAGQVRLAKAPPETAELSMNETGRARLDENPLGDLLAEPAFGDADSEQDSFGQAFTVRVGDPLSAAGELSDQVASDLIEADGSVELKLEDQSVEVIDDLDSIFDSDAVDEPTLARNEMLGARPSGVDAFQIPLSGRDSSEASLSAEQESVPTDLLSSQWQMDSGIWDETATKLDLARAYIEMDDGDAAREILEEVIVEGREEQRAEAQALLKKLA